MKASLKQLVNSKEYKVIRNSKFTAQNKANLKNYATEKGMLSVVSLLNKDSLPQYRQTNAKVVKRYIIYFNKYKKGDYTALGNATKLMSFYFANLIGNSYLITDRKKNYEAIKFVKLEATDINEKVLKSFKKIRQWPHLTMYVFPVLNVGSCHDYTILQAMFYEKHNIKYKLYVSGGLNTYMSHIYTRKVKLQDAYRLPNFLLLSLFHCFRAYQTLKYKLQNKRKVQTLVNTVYTIVYKCTNSSEKAKMYTDFLFSRKKFKQSNFKF